MNTLNQLFANMTKAWNSSGTTSKILVGGSVAVTVLTMIAVSVWSSTPDYKLLRDQLPPQQAAEIVSQLEAVGIPTKLNYSGSGVMVPAGRWNEANVAIASISDVQDAIPGPSLPGFTGGTGHDANVRAREIALEKSLASLQAVKSADVHLAIPKKSPFRKDRQIPSASVIVETAGGHVLSMEIAQSIVQTVASAVEGLEPENVSLTDSAGQLVGGGMQDPASLRRNYVAEIESKLALKAQDLLSAVLGPNRSVVRVTAVVDDFSDKVIEKRQILTEGKAPLRVLTITSDQKGVSPNSNGAAGTASNGAASPSVLGSGDPFSGKSEESETTYDYPETKETERVIGGQIQRLSISATVDTSPADPEADPNAAPSLTQEQVENIIKTAVGFDTARGDQLEVVMAKFSDEEVVALDVAIPEAEKWQFISQLAKNASLGLAALAALIVAMMVVKKLQPIEVKSPATAAQRDAILSTLSNRVDENPEALSKLLAAWINSEDGVESQRKAA